MPTHPRSCAFPARRVALLGFLSPSFFFWNKSLGVSAVLERGDMGRGAWVHEVDEVLLVLRATGGTFLAGCSLHRQV